MHFQWFGTQDIGYATDFVQVTMGPLLNEIKRQGIRVVSNSGGVNPQACCEALQQVAKKAGVDLKIAVVTGDDLMRQVLYRCLSVTHYDSHLPVSPQNISIIND